MASAAVKATNLALPCVANSPTVAADSKGRLWVVWREGSFGSVHVWAARSDKENGVWAWDATTWKQLPVLWRPQGGAAGRFHSAQNLR